MGTDDIRAAIADHEERLAYLESIIGKLEKGKQSAKAATKKQKKNSLPEHIIELRENGFFAEPRTAVDVHQKLKSKYHADDDRVAMALLRLGTRRELRKTTKTIESKKYKAYVW